MQTDIAPEFAATADGVEAEAILRKCVHCGFCTATCPTYQLLGDELDGQVAVQKPQCTHLRRIASAASPSGVPLN